MKGTGRGRNGQEKEPNNRFPNDSKIDSLHEHHVHKPFHKSSNPNGAKTIDQSQRHMILFSGYFSFQSETVEQQKAHHH